jgi:hypothetical protein
MRNWILAITTVCALALFSGACSKHRSGPPRAKIDACTLLTAEDMQEVQNSPLKGKTGNQTGNGKIFVSQCYFAADPPHQSISLATTQSDPASNDPDGAEEYWRNIARHAEQKPESEEEREKRESLKEHERGEEEGEAAPLKKIAGVGEAAYWAGSRVGGALYVFQKDVIVRVSVGGPDTEQAKIDKSKKVAAKALQRL